MGIFSEIEKYRDYEFSSGCTVGEDYKTFQRKYRNAIKKMCDTYGWELVKFNKGHYEFSAYIRNEEGKYVYMAISDVRYNPNKWLDRILIRRAWSLTDSVGCVNFYSDLCLLDANISMIFTKL